MFILDEMDTRPVISIDDDVIQIAVEVRAVDRLSALDRAANVMREAARQLDEVVEQFERSLPVATLTELGDARSVSPSWHSDTGELVGAR